jgi:hypothetical protein
MRASYAPGAPAWRRTARSVGPMAAPLAALSRRARALNGLGDCPSFAPFPTAGGGCSNIAPGVDAHAFYQSGGQASDAGVVGSWTGTTQAEMNCPAGTKINPVTGRTECVNPTAAKYTTSSGYVLRTSSDENIMREIAAAAEAEARARGIPARCSVTFMGGDLLRNNQPQYSADCMIEGQQYSASEMLTGGGMETTIIGMAYNRGEPMYQTPFFAASGGYQFLPSTAEAAVRPAAAVQTPGGQSGAAAVVQPGATAAPAAPAAPKTTGQILTDVSAIAADAKAAASGIPSWVWLAAAAGGAFLLFRGGKR